MAKECERLAAALAALPAMSPAQLQAAWNEAGAGPAPNVPVNLLRRLVAQRLQEQRYGRLPLPVVRELERSAKAEVSSKATPRTVATPSPGTRLIREWKGKTIAVEVRDDGYVWEDKVYRSLSEIARKVTGAHWSGPRFFGLRRNG